MASYLVSTPGNPNFSGKVYGITFTNGRAFVSDQTVDSRLGWSADQIAFSMKKDFGYDVVEVAPSGSAPAPVFFPGNIPPEMVYAESLKGIPVNKEVPVAEAPAPEPEPEPEGDQKPEPTPEPEAPEFAEASPAPAEDTAAASPKRKRTTRRKGAEDSEPAE